MTAPVAIGIDLGGTNLKGAAVDRAGEILARKTIPLTDSRKPETVMARMVELVDALLASISIDRSGLIGVGVGAPGPMSQRSGRIIRAANLPGWVDVPLRDRLAERLGLPVAFDNDGNAAAFGEFWVGAGEGGDDLVMLTLGTGVGAGVILGGCILHGHFENAAELGHVIVEVDGHPCPCGQRGCLEQYASASAIARRAEEATRAGEPGALAAALQQGKPVDGEQVSNCARDGDPLCLRIWDEACQYLAVACINIQHTYNPARIVLGGGMSEAGAFLIDRVKDHVARRRWSLHDDIPTIALAKLGYDAGVIGAAGLVMQVAADTRSQI